MGILGDIFNLVRDGISGAADSAIMNKALQLRNSPLIRKLDEVSCFGDGGLGDFEASSYVQRSERLPLFYAYALARGVRAGNLATVFRMIFGNSFSYGINSVKRNCTSSIRPLAELAISVLETLGQQDSEIKRFITKQ